MADLDPASLDLPTLAALAGSAASEHLLQELRAAGYRGVRASHGYIVQRLIDAEPTVGEIATDLGITQQAVSKTVAEMEGLGLVTRRVGPDDGRIRRLVLTPAGAALIESVRASRAELERAVATTVGDLGAAKAALVALLEAAGGIDAVRTRRARPVG